MNAPTTSGQQVASGYGYSGEQHAGNLASPELDIRAIFKTLRKRMGLIIAITMGITILVMVAVYQMTPIYTGKAQILLQAQKENVVDIEAVMSGLASDSAAIDSQVAILKSRSLAGRVVDELNLVNDPEFNSSLTSPSIFRWLDPRRWPGEIASLFKSTQFSETGSEEESNGQERNAVISAFMGHMGVSRQERTYVLSVEFRSRDAKKAARIANKIAHTYIVDQLEAKFDATKQANDWLSKRLQSLRQQVQASERAVEIYRSKNGLETAKGTTVNEQQLSELNAQLILAKANLAEKQANYDRARQALHGSGDIESVASVMQSGTISGLRQQEAQLAREQADLSSKYGPRHPAIIKIEAQRADIKQQIKTEARRVVDSIKNQADVARSRVDALQKSLDQLKAKTSENDQAEIRLRELQREADANKTVYESFLNRFKQTSQQANLQTPDARVISEAMAPGAPSSPKKGLIGGASLILSLMIGVGMAFLLEHLDNGIETGRALEEFLEIPNLASIPAIPSEKGEDGKTLSPERYVLAKPLSAFSESIRSLRSALQLSNVDNPPKIVAFTSALPNEGKTTMAACFARATAVSGLKVVLVDCDLRHPSIQKTFELESAKTGLVELLAGRLEPSSVLIRDPLTTLDILPVASGAANPPDVLGSEQMKRLLQDLRNTYDLVVLDTAPVLPVSDSRVLSRLVDETVFVVRWSVTPKDAALSALRELRNFNASIAGAVLSIVDTSKQARYGYGDSGYYYRQYSKYYVN